MAAVRPAGPGADDDDVAGVRRWPWSAGLQLGGSGPAPTAEHDGADEQEHAPEDEVGQPDVAPRDEVVDQDVEQPDGADASPGPAPRYRRPRRASRRRRLGRRSAPCPVVRSRTVSTASTMRSAAWAGQSDENTLTECVVGEVVVRGRSRRTVGRRGRERVPPGRARHAGIVAVLRAGGRRGRRQVAASKRDDGAAVRRPRRGSVHEHARRRASATVARACSTTGPSGVLSARRAATQRAERDASVAVPTAR